MSEPQELKLFFPLCFGGKNRPKKNNNNKKQPMKVDHYTITYVYKIMGYTHVVFWKKTGTKTSQKVDSYTQCRVAPV